MKLKIEKKELIDLTDGPQVVSNELTPNINGGRDRLSGGPAFGGGRGGEESSPVIEGGGDEPERFMSARDVNTQILCLDAETNFI
jgi:hypothetical protein